MNLLPHNTTRTALNLLEAKAREAQICVQILVANIGKPDPYLILDNFQNAYRNVCNANTSATEEICTTCLGHIQNSDLGRLAGTLHQIPQELRTFSRKAFLLVSHIDTNELSRQTSLLQRISDTTTEMIVMFCRRHNLETMISRRNALKLLEEENDKLTQERICKTLKKDLDPLKTIVLLSFCNSIRELIDICLNAGNSAFELHLKYA